ncbi:phosphoglycerate dehydrogenase [Pedobacter kyungheensis]|uniref:Phosphoglycerate dehydrogenase n=1 Tax=Pedobacter kyungheensis TaxID=1069985 RepID=A0A0C1FQL1_9SPHI|nr:hydroxyacid dehydrogenase [Pedobacter kyungheensis]KIA94058.1 phosphoglycerate dehydrogenase [Pedobacter kyungheensis]
MKKNVLLLETIADEALALLEENANVFEGYTEGGLNEVLGRIEVHAVITRGKGQIDKRLMDCCPDLEVVARCGVGLDNVDVAEATARKIRVVNAPGSNAATIAEHTLALMLMLMRNLYQSVERVKQHDWNWRNQYAGDELNGKTLGILGMGNIGKRVAKLGEAFGMKVLYWSRTTQNLPMEELLKQSDVISLHLPLTQETNEIIGAAQLALMKPTAFLINTARGALINHAALLDALNANTIAGFAADVLPDEPPVENLSVVQHPHALITPHTASLTAATYQRMCLLTVKNVLAILGGGAAELNSVYNRDSFI